MDKQEAKKAPETKKSSSALPKFVSFVALIVIIAIAVYVFTRSPPSTPSTADPGNVVIKISDLPLEWGETMATYKTPTNYATGTGYTGPLPETGYYVKFSKDSASFVSEAIRFSSASDAEAFYDYLYGISPTGQGVSHTKVGDESFVMVFTDNIAGFFRKSNYVVYNAAEVEFTLSDFMGYLNLCEDRV